MRNECAQASLFDTYADVRSAMESDKPKLIRMLEEHIDFSSLIPTGFHRAFYSGLGRPREYSLESFIRFFVLQKILGVPHDSLMLNILRLSQELRGFCGFARLPDAAKFTRFRQNYAGCLNKNEIVNSSFSEF